jgi:hypothetical protein
MKNVTAREIADLTRDLLPTFRLLLDGKPVPHQIAICQKLRLEKLFLKGANEDTANRRLSLVLASANDAFWETVRNAYPEAAADAEEDEPDTGALDDVMQDLGDAQLTAVEAWLERYTPVTQED